jgi:hypothetical protein
VLYLFNPLPELGMRALLTKLERSLQAQPRDVYVVYHNPEHRAWLENSWLREFTGTHRFVIYRSAGQRE